MTQRRISHRIGRLFQWVSVTVAGLALAMGILQHPHVEAADSIHQAAGMAFDINVWTVLIAALITALATGLGALPFLFLRGFSPYWISVANAVACGLMLAASHALIEEGVGLGPERVLIGILIGLALIVLAQRWIDGSDDLKIASLGGFDARKAFLIIAVMTAHSFAEGVGVGVSFGGTEDLATFITAAIAVHNIPEGLAIALVLVPRGTPVWQAALWGVFSSLPQPIAAVPSYLAVSAFAPFLPIGFGIAAGAMFWMVFAELLPDANKNASPGTVGLVVTFAFAAMLAFQVLILKD